MEEYLKELCAPHFWPIVITIAVMIVLMASGVAIRPLLVALFGAIINKLKGGGETVNINLGANVKAEMAEHGRKMGANVKAEMAEHGRKMGVIMDAAKEKAICEACAKRGMVDPNMCPMHQAEKDRSLRNEKSICDLWTHIGDVERSFRAEVAAVYTLINSNQGTIIAELRHIAERIAK